MPVSAVRTTRRRWRTALAGVTALAVGSALLVAAQQASAAPTGPDPQKAVGYLTARSSSTVTTTTRSASQQADWGLTIDGALALAAQGGNDAAYVKLVDFLAANGKDQAGTDVISWTGIGTDYPDGGSIGKLALLAETAGRNPRAFAGADLVAELAKTVCAGTTPIGSSACAGKGNYAGGSSVFKQALGLIGQVRGGADSAAVAAPTEFLLGLQNADGGWPGLIPSGGAGSDVDSTVDGGHGPHPGSRRHGGRRRAARHRLGGRARSCPTARSPGTPRPAASPPTAPTPPRSPSRRCACRPATTRRRSPRRTPSSPAPRTPTAASTSTWAPTSPT